MKIPETELVEEFIRPASGPGGQHLNKTSNGVRLHWNLAQTTVLNEEQKERLRKIAAPYLCDDEIVICEHGERSLLRNRENAKNRLMELAERSLTAPKKRKKTKATKASKERRLKAKAIRSRIKALRSGRED